MKKLYLGEKIKRIRKEKKLTQQQLANIVGYNSKSTISEIEKGTNDIPTEKLHLIAKALNVNISDLIDEQPKGNTKSIPLLGEICAGNGIYAKENRLGEIQIDKTIINADFSLKIKGDSMIGENIIDGDIAFFDQHFDFIDGKIYAIIKKGLDTGEIKKVFKKNDKYLLQPCNNNYQPALEDCDDIIICGKFKGILRNYG